MIWNSDYVSDIVFESSLI